MGLDAQFSSFLFFSLHPWVSCVHPCAELTIMPLFNSAKHVDNLTRAIPWFFNLVEKSTSFSSYSSSFTCLCFLSCISFFSSFLFSPFSWLFNLNSFLFFSFFIFLSSFTSLAQQLSFLFFLPARAFQFFFPQFFATFLISFFWWFLSISPSSFFAPNVIIYTPKLLWPSWPSQLGLFFLFSFLARCFLNSSFTLPFPSFFFILFVLQASLLFFPAKTEIHDWADRWWRRQSRRRRQSRAANDGLGTRMEAAMAHGRETCSHGSMALIRTGHWQELLWVGGEMTRRTGQWWERRCGAWWCGHGSMAGLGCCRRRRQREELKCGEEMWIE